MSDDLTEAAELVTSLVRDQVERALDLDRQRREACARAERFADRLSRIETLLTGEPWANPKHSVLGRVWNIVREKDDADAD